MVDLYSDVNYGNDYRKSFAYYKPVIVKMKWKWDIEGENLRKDTASSRKLVSTIGA